MTAAALLRFQKRQGWTQAQLASALGIAPRTVRRYLAGEWPIPKLVELAVQGLDLGGLV